MSEITEAAWRDAVLTMLRQRISVETILRCTEAPFSRAELERMACDDAETPASGPDGAL